MPKNVIESASVTTNERFSERPGAIQFKLEGNKAFDEGWIKMKKGTDMYKKSDPIEEDNLDLEEMTIIKWAANRLGEALKTYELEKQKSKYKYLFEVLTIDYYSRSKNEKLESKGVDFSKRDYQNISKLPFVVSSELKLEESVENVFYIKHPDKSIICYYPNGKPAIVQSVSKNVIDTLILDEDDGSMVGNFSNRGFGMLDEIAGKKLGIDVRMSLKKNCVLYYNPMGGKIYDVDTQNCKRSWSWPKFGTLGQSVSYKINKNITLHGGNLDKLTLTFRSLGRVLRLSVSCHDFSASYDSNFNNGSKILKSSMKNHDKLLCDIQWNSNTAKILSGQDKALQKQNLKGRKNKQRERTKQMLQDNDIESNHEGSILDISKDTWNQELNNEYNKTKFVEQDLLKIKTRAKAVVEEWMENYRVLTGVKLVDDERRKIGSRHLDSRKAGDRLRQVTTSTGKIKTLGALESNVLDGIDTQIVKNNAFVKNEKYRLVGDCSMVETDDTDADFERVRKMSVLGTKNLENAIKTRNERKNEPVTSRTSSQQSFRDPSAPPKYSKYFGDRSRPRTADMTRRVKMATLNVKRPSTAGSLKYSLDSVGSRDGSPVKLGLELSNNNLQ